MKIQLYNNMHLVVIVGREVLIFKWLLEKPFLMKIREVFSIMKEWIGRICLWRRFKLHNGLFNRLWGSVALIP